MICHQHKFIFIQIPKTGTESVCACLLKLISEKTQIQELKNKHIYGGCSHHATLEQIIHKTKNQFDDYFIFTFTRNPFDRILSEYHYIPKYLDLVANKKIPMICKNLRGYTADKFRDQFPTFSSYITNKPAPLFVDEHDRHQHLFIPSTRNAFFGKFENLQHDFNVVCDRIGIDRQTLPHVNKSNHKPYTEYYDSECRDIVENMYKQDIKHFKYN